MDVKEIAALLDKYPDIKQRLKEMLDIVEGPNRGEFGSPRLCVEIGNLRQEKL